MVIKNRKNALENSKELARVEKYFQLNKQIISEMVATSEKKDRQTRINEWRSLLHQSVITGYPDVMSPVDSYDEWVEDLAEDLIEKYAEDFEKDKIRQVKMLRSAPAKQDPKVYQKSKTKAGKEYKREIPQKFSGRELRFFQNTALPAIQSKSWSMKEAYNQHLHLNRAKDAEGKHLVPFRTYSSFKTKVYRLRKTLGK